jgi:diguanylate cyclase (GGDEF)-like protein
MDLFEHEESVQNAAHQALRELQRNETDKCDVKLFADLLNEYERLLKQLVMLSRSAGESMDYIITDRQKQVEKANLDDLTQINNRRYLNEHIDDVYKTISLTNGILGFMMIDIDFFKKYNDAYGHTAGDDCLKTVAQTIVGSVNRAGGFAARYGGEEFAVVLPNVDENGACIIAEKILKNVRACNIPHESSEAADIVTVSIGVATGIAKRDQTYEDFIKRADEALYEAKENGRNRYTSVDLS